MNTENEEEKKAVLEVTSNVLYVHFWLLVGLISLCLEGKTLPACNVLLHALSKQATKPDFFSPSLIKTVVLLAARCRSAGQKMLGYQ